MQRLRPAGASEQTGGVNPAFLVYETIRWILAMFDGFLDFISRFIFIGKGVLAGFLAGRA